MTCTMFTRPDGTHAAGMMKLPPNMEGVPPNWTNYFQVDDVNATIATATGNGGRIIVPATAVQVGTFAILADPQGATFGVIQMAR